MMEGVIVIKPEPNPDEDVKPDVNQCIGSYSNIQDKGSRLKASEETTFQFSNVKEENEIDDLNKNANIFQKCKVENIKEEYESDNSSDYDNEIVHSQNETVDSDTKIGLDKSGYEIRNVKTERNHFMDDTDISRVTTRDVDDVEDYPANIDYSKISVKSECVSDEEEREENEFANFRIDQLLESSSSSDESSKNEPQYDLTDSIIVNSDGKLQCKDCGKLFKKKYNLKRHIRSHRKIRPFICMGCGKSFSLKYSLEQHERIHSGEKPYKCEQCGKCFSVRSILTRHQLIHTGVKPFECEKCGKHFTQKAQLVQHLRAHMGVKAYECSICGRGFTEKRTLFNHTSGHNGLTPYPCSYCGKGFTHKSSMMRHKKLNCRVAKEANKNLLHDTINENSNENDSCNDKSVSNL